MLDTLEKRKVIFDELINVLLKEAEFHGNTLSRDYIDGVIGDFELSGNETNELMEFIHGRDINLVSWYETLDDADLFKSFDEEILSFDPDYLRDYDTEISSLSYNGKSLGIRMVELSGVIDNRYRNHFSNNKLIKLEYDRNSLKNKLMISYDDDDCEISGIDFYAMNIANSRRNYRTLRGGYDVTKINSELVTGGQRDSDLTLHSTYDDLDSLDGVHDQVESEDNATPLIDDFDYDDIIDVHGYDYSWFKINVETWGIEFAMMDSADDCIAFKFTIDYNQLECCNVLEDFCVYVTSISGRRTDSTGYLTSVGSTPKRLDIWADRHSHQIAFGPTFRKSEIGDIDDGLKITISFKDVLRNYYVRKTYTLEDNTWFHEELFAFPSI